VKKALRLSALAALVTCFPGPLGAWNSFGHMVVASVAYRQMDSQTRAKVDKLLALNPYFKTTWASMIPPGTSTDDRKRFIFMLAATWPDEIKSDGKYQNDGSRNGDVPDGPEPSRNTGYDDFNRHKYWHFEDNPLTQDGSNISSFKVPSPNAETQIAVFRGVLRSSAAAPLKSYDLVWLLHLTGDVHQPLHCSTRVSSSDPAGDNGGNGVLFCKSTTACSAKLHAFWDDVLGTSTKVAAADAFAKTIVAPTVPASDIADAKTWIDSSFKLALSDVYMTPVLAGDGPFEETTTYITNAKKVAETQVGLAGARLAAVLKADLK
jgi:S1/P1 Nuclease